MVSSSTCQRVVCSLLKCCRIWPGEPNIWWQVSVNTSGKTVSEKQNLFFYLSPAKNNNWRNCQIICRVGKSGIELHQRCSLKEYLLTMGLSLLKTFWFNSNGPGWKINLWLLEFNFPSFLSLSIEKLIYWTFVLPFEVYIIYSVSHLIL